MYTACTLLLSTTFLCRFQHIASHKNIMFLFIYCINNERDSEREKREKNTFYTFAFSPKIRVPHIIIYMLSICATFIIYYYYILILFFIYFALLLLFYLFNVVVVVVARCQKHQIKKNTHTRQRSYIILGTSSNRCLKFWCLNRRAQTKMFYFILF